MSPANPLIYIVDDDNVFSRSLARLVKSIGFDVETFQSAEKFMKRKPWLGPCCLLLDVRMPGLTGPGLQRELAEKEIQIPIIFLTGRGDVSTGVEAMKDGAVDFLLKPVEEEKLFEAIDRALDKDTQLKKEQDELDHINCLLASLTPREDEILRWIITGMLNKQIAARLKITERTVKAHRGEIMHKLNIVSVAELVRLTQKVNISPATERVDS